MNEQRISSGYSSMETSYQALWNIHIVVLTIFIVNIIRKKASKARKRMFGVQYIKYNQFQIGIPKYPDLQKSVDGSFSGELVRLELLIISPLIL